VKCIALTLVLSLALLGLDTVTLVQESAPVAPDCPRQRRGGRRSYSAFDDKVSS
jgi:hypothetical protein